MLHFVIKKSIFSAPMFLYKYRSVYGAKMSINPIMLNQEFPEIAKDYINIKNSIDKNGNSVVFEAMPIYGRINTLPEKLAEKDYAPAMGLVSLAILNGPEERGKYTLRRLCYPCF